MDILTFLTEPQYDLDRDIAAQFASSWHVLHAKKGQNLSTQGITDPFEWIVLDGRLTSQISDPEGSAICVGFYAAPCVVTPNIARSKNSLSLVSLGVAQDALVARLDTNALTEQMLVSEPIRNWANAILQQELTSKADREWCLAALAGADRLSWFRKEYPEYEAQFSHGLIASFLGITPVTLSRLRRAREKE